MKTLALVICLAAVSTTTAQADYSESTVYVPRDLSQLLHSKKSKKKTPDAPVTATPPTLVSSPIPIVVSVLDAKGARIANLKKEDLKIFIGDKEAEIKSFTWTTGPMNIVLLIDVSPSAALKPQEVQQIANLLVDRFGPDEKIMLADFNDRLTILTDFTTDRDILRKAIGKFPSDGGGTSLYDSITKLCMDRDLTANSNTAVVLVTDGVDTTSLKQDYASSILVVESSHVPIFPIYLDTLSANAQPARPAPGSWQAVFPNVPGVSVPQPLFRAYDMTKEYEVGQLYLSDLVFATGGTAFTVPGFRASPAQIAKQIHERYFVTVQPSDPMNAGQRYPVRVRVNIPNLAVIARGSYIAK